MITPKQQPILFSTPMVQAILLGTKTQTRRIIKSRHESGLLQVCRRATTNEVVSIESLDWNENNCDKDITPRWKIGDVLWVKETFQDAQCFDFHMKGFVYRADKAAAAHAEEFKINWRPSLFMPKEAARIFLKITDIRVERLLDISEKDAISEGIERVNFFGEEFYKDYLYKPTSTENRKSISSPVKSYSTLWKSINGIESWEKNPFVWVIEFEKLPV